MNTGISDSVVAGRALQLLEHRPSVDAGHAHVEEHRVGRLVAHERERLVTVGRGDHAVARLLEVDADELADVRLVVDHEDHGHRIEARSTGAARCQATRASHVDGARELVERRQRLGALPHGVDRAGAALALDGLDERLADLVLAHLRLEPEQLVERAP